MKIIDATSLKKQAIYPLKDQDWIDKQRIAGKVAAQALILLESEVYNKTSKTLLELSELAENLIVQSNCTPTFKGYKGFPAAVCISVNKQLVHGIPTDYQLQDGDIVKFDLGATYQGAIADTALTCVYGTTKSIHQKLILACEEALFKGISAIRPGKQLGEIGHAISRSIKQTEFGLITQYGGHGLSWDAPHAPPFVANRAEINEGIRFQPGMTLAIEPMTIIGSTQTSVAQDGWTVLGYDISAHFEHSVFLHEDHLEIMTWRPTQIFKNKIVNYV